MQVKLGASLHSDRIRESSDVYLECLVRAHPPVGQIFWLRDGQQLQSKPRDGLLLANQSLVLQRVHRTQAGSYSCKAVNSLGFSTSQPFKLKVNCKFNKFLI